MSLCPQSRCGCTLTSSSLQVTGKVGGAGYNIETYEGVATEDPDTLPGPGDRFEGMRVWLADTKRLVIWDDDMAQWRILQEPPQAWVATMTQGVALSGTASGWFERRMGTVRGVVNFVISSAGTSGQQITLTPPVTMQNTAPNVGGSFRYIDAGAAVYVGTIVGGSTPLDPFRLAAEDTTSGSSNLGASPSLAAASGDAFAGHIYGRYDESVGL